MNLLIDRKYKKADYTIGNLYVNNTFFCNTLEDTDRGLKCIMKIEEIKDIKRAGVTAIPTGTYTVKMNITSPKYSLKSWYIKNCHGAKMPRLLDVPGFSGVLIHPGNTALDTDGCILVGKNTVKGMVTDSKNTFLKLYNKMYDAYEADETILLTIK